VVDVARPAARCPLKGTRSACARHARRQAACGANRRVKCRPSRGGALTSAPSHSRPVSRVDGVVVGSVAHDH
jgi:hypothetical protein